jgi:hypothetical protein
MNLKTAGLAALLGVLRPIFILSFQTAPRKKLHLHVLFMSNNLPDEEKDMNVIERGSIDDDLPDETWKEIEQGQPSQVQIMKEVRVGYVTKMVLTMLFLNTIFSAVLSSYLQV